MIDLSQDAGSPVEAGAVLPFGLTIKEVCVLQLLAEGFTLKMVARARGGSRHTVKNQVELIRNKLTAKNIPHAVYIACKCGLIT